jgi:hypothetical protein
MSTMKNRWRLFVSIACSALVLAFGPAQAEPAKELEWSDLVGSVAAYDDPFLALSAQQITRLSIVAKIRERIAANKVTEAEIEEEKQAVEWLVGQGVDVDGLLERREEIRSQRQAAAEATNPSLNGKRIRMPGFMLPLEFADDRVTEFLLVPFVGACIHVPPPPPNQIVYVSAKTSYKHSNMYEPVWIEGRMSVGTSDHDLFLKDGSAAVPTGYSMIATRVEPY